jgi:hypothetical protein
VPWNGLESRLNPVNQFLGDSKSIPTIFSFRYPKRRKSGGAKSSEYVDGVPRRDAGMRLFQQPHVICESVDCPDVGSTPSEASERLKFTGMI